MNSLPVMLISAVVGGVLAGPVLAGMYDTVLRAPRRSGHWSTYRRAFRQNWKSQHPARHIYCVVVTMQIFWCISASICCTRGQCRDRDVAGHGALLLLFHMLFAYMWPQVVLLDQPLTMTLKTACTA